MRTNFHRIWENYGTRVVVSTDNITTRNGCERLFKTALQLGPIGGIFNLAVVLRDSILENQSVEKFVECMLPKATATEYLGKNLKAKKNEMFPLKINWNKNV